MSDLKRVLVTGASKGLGRAIALQLAASGFHITVHYRSDVRGADETCAHIKNRGQSCDLISFDVAQRADVRKTLEQVIDQKGAYYGVVCNAGICRDNAFPALTDEDWDSVIHTNLDGFYNVLQPCIMPMIRAKQGGRIVTLASLSGVIGNRGQVNYSASKAGIIGATKALALELAKRNITVNCVAPGLIDTAMIGDANIEELLPHIPLRRLGKPEEVAGLVSYLMSDVAAYVTRQVFNINGGIA
jgi:3-oxoacyl-[acyl-carrier protein] reductase